MLHNRFTSAAIAGWKPKTIRVASVITWWRVLYHISTSWGLSIGYCGDFAMAKDPRMNRGGCVRPICSLAALSVQGRPRLPRISTQIVHGGLASVPLCHIAVLLYYSCICPWRIRIMLETQTRQVGVSRVPPRSFHRSDISTNANGFILFCVGLAR
jgi:hypothetical protein